jgi:predicted dehydrogenase
MGIVGVGGMARHHINNLLKQTDTTRVVAICEPNPDNAAKATKLFTDAGLPSPQNEPDFEKFVEDIAAQGLIDAVFIITPHNQHCAQASALLMAGVDVLLEKPMVLNVEEARKLIAARDQSGKLLTIAFNGSLSPAIRRAHEMIHSGDLGRVLNINANVWQNWNRLTIGTWRQIPEVAGGGFTFDTGAHLLNTVADLVGEPFAEVCAYMDNRNRPVDILSVAIARTVSGVLITLNGCGDTVRIGSGVHVMCEKGIVNTGVWGEHLTLQTANDPAPVKVELPESFGVWQTFLKVRAGEMLNPGTAEVGLRMIQLWDAIKASAQQHGKPVQITL